MQTVVKLALSMLIILACSQIGRKWPTLGGLIATMPLTGVIVLLWLYTDTEGDATVLASYVKGALWGILPSILFFLAAYLCLSRGWSLPWAVAVGFSAWLGGAAVHQWLLG